MGMPSQTYRVVCTRCLEEEDARWMAPGSHIVEVLLYIVTLPFLCVGGLWYTGLRAFREHWACRVCGSRDVVPTASRRGQAILQERG